MKTVPEALACVLNETVALPVETVPLTQALGRRLFAEVLCPADVPPFDKSLMDGFACLARDVASLPATLRVVGEVAAGHVWQGYLQSGETIRIMTGAPLPAGVDTIIPLERVEDQWDCIVLHEQPLPGRFLLKTGELMRRGEQLLSAGAELRPQEIALLAEIGQVEVVVHRRPSVAVLATGDELVPMQQEPGPGQIRNSNEPMLLSQTARCGAVPYGLGIADDLLEELRQKVQQGLGHDILLLSGGVSMGSRDLVPQVLASLGVRPVFHRVQLKPGKPIWFGVWEAGDGSSRRTLIFGLPGNPVSSMVCFELFVKPAIQRLLGGSGVGRTPWKVRLAVPHQHREDRPTCFPSAFRWGADGAEVVPTGWKGSSDLRSTTEANGIILFPPGDRLYAAGELVEFVSWD